jgi:hypothetical protein
MIYLLAVWLYTYLYIFLLAIWFYIVCLFVYELPVSSLAVYLFTVCI